MQLSLAKAVAATATVCDHGPSLTKRTRLKQQLLGKVRPLAAAWLKVGPASTGEPTGT